MFFNRPGLKIHGCTWLFVPILCFSDILVQPKKPPQQETKLEKGCIQSLGENLCSFQENHLSIVLQTEKMGCFSGQDSQELAAPLGSLFSRS